LTELIEHAVRLVEEDALSLNIDIQTDIQDLSKIPLDANQMTQAILNLLLNALQAVKNGGRIEVGAELNPSDRELRPNKKKKSLTHFLRQGKREPDWGWRSFIKL
jgi:two-component system sensor histidine kinase HydH